MKLIITDSANKWFQDNYGLKSGDGVRIYGKTVQPRDVHHGPWQGFAPENDLSNATIVEKKMELTIILILTIAGSFRD